jgi:hypothetical protein
MEWKIRSYFQDSSLLMILEISRDISSYKQNSEMRDSETDGNSSDKN